MTVESNQTCPEAPDSGDHHWVPGPADHHGSRPMMCDYCFIPMKVWREKVEQAERKKRAGL